MSTTRDSVTLEWKPPKDDGGSPITGYIIEKREAMRMTWSRADKTTDDKTTKTVKGLVTGDEFYFRVAAVNKQGSSEFLEMPRPVTIKSPYGELPFLLLRLSCVHGLVCICCYFCGTIHNAVIVSFFYDVICFKGIQQCL